MLSLLCLKLWNWPLPNSGGGQTGRTSAHIMPWYDDFYYLIQDVHGEGIAKQVADSYKTIIDWYENSIKEEGIECNFERVNGYLFPHDSSSEADTKIKKVTSYVPNFQTWLHSDDWKVSRPFTCMNTREAIHYP
jgi:hypothetical protein